MSSSLHQLCNSIVKCNYIVNNKLKGITDIDLSIFNLPNKTELAIYQAANVKATLLKNSQLMYNCNYSNKSIIQIKKYVFDSFYAKQKLDSYAFSKINDDLFNEGNVIIGSAKFDFTKSIFHSDRIYNLPEILKHIDVLETHFVKITKLNDMEIQIEHFTQKPFNTVDFIYVSDVNLRGQFITQYQCTNSFKVNKNVLVYFEKIKIKDPLLENK